MKKEQSHISSTPDYAFEKGLRITERTFTPDGIQENETVMTPDALAVLPNAGGDNERDAYVAEMMQRTKVARGLGGIAVEYALVGNHNAGEIMAVRYGWGGDMSHPVAVNEAQALVAANQDKQIMFMNLPGVGQSGVLERAAAKQIARTGNYGPLGEVVASAVEPILRDYDEVHLRGHSMGGRTAIAMATALNKPIASLVVNDPPGSRNLGLTGIAENFILKEGGHGGKYMQTPLDARAARLQQQPLSLFFRQQAGLLRSGGFVGQWLRDPLAMSRESLAQDLAEAAPNVERVLVVGSPELSELNKWQDISKILGALTDKTEASVRQRIIHDHTHVIVNAPSVLAHMYRESL